MMTRLALMVWLALRNLRRQARRSVLTALAMIIGGALLMFSVSLGDGTHEDWIESAVRMGSGHIAIQAPGFQLSRKIDDRLTASARAAAEAALRSPGVASHVVSVVPRLATDGLASSPNGARPARIIGVDPTAEAAYSILDDKLVEGRYLKTGDRLAAYVGEGLAEALDLRIGARLVVTAQDASGDIAGQLVRVVGIFKSGVPEIDQAIIHVPLTTAGSWLGVGDDITTLAVLLDSSYRVPGYTRTLRRLLAVPIADGQVALLGWREAMPELDAAVKVDNLGNYMFQGVTFGIIALAIVNTILMAVLHRRREFGLLQAMGLSPRETGALVLIEGVIITALSGLIGIGLGVFLTWLFWRNGLDISFTWDADWSFSGVVLDPIIVPMFRLARIAQGLVFILFIGAVASVYPALRAARIDVAEAMKFDR